MAISVLDSAIFADMFGTSAMGGIFGDQAFLARCVEVEAALARAQGRLGIIPAEAGEAMTATEPGTREIVVEGGAIVPAKLDDQLAFDTPRDIRAGDRRGGK